MEARFVLFEDSANLDATLVYDCKGHTIFLEINLDAPNGTPR